MSAGDEQSPATESGEDGDTDARDDAPADGDEAAELATRLEALRKENRQLRESYRRAKRSEYRRTALGFLALAALTALAGVAFPSARTVLFALAGTGAFGALLTYYLTPERVVAASVTERVYDAHAKTADAIVGDLGLADERVYAPTPADPTAPARLFVPQHERHRVPDLDDVTDAFVVTDDDRERGLALHATGAGLIAELESSLPDALAETDRDVAPARLADGVVEALELADDVTPIDADDGVAFSVTGATYGDPTRVDHPVTSTLAVGVAVAFDAPVTVDVSTREDDRGDAVVTCTPVEQSP